MVDAGGASHGVDPAVDVWALGVIAFELFCGRRLFPPGTDSSDITAQLLGRDPLPWEAGGGVAGAELEACMRGLRGSVLQCLAREARERPTSAEVLGQWDSIFAAA